ncbi:23S rRNA (uracil(1939)-C(5))-methyltransferase RlmD [Granulicella arctica]|uniref:23S rRNA (uracil(1939)-C(5))-methyltransferase RlmD n=1 Tax=Granulicella arctica TaxID=940613 RepID=UPI0021E0EFA6|nr:23S rRNA (uracil(1939)-C(5))-methyltransferase RlmD [Granulicella arctica]
MNIQIDTMIYGGAGTAPLPDGTTIAVPFTLPGEHVTINGHNEVSAILEASPDRVPAPCPHFGPCGGCQYQHATYPAQTRIKQTILHKTLATTGLTNLPETVIHTAEPWGYRNRIRLRVAIVDGTLRIGYNRRGTYEMLPIVACPISAPLLLRAAEAVLAAAAATQTWDRKLNEIELFTNSDQSSLQITFFLRTEKAIDLKAFCTQLKFTIPELAGAGITIVGESGRKDQPGANWGAAGLQYRAAGRDYWVTRGNFFQVNRFLVDALIALVTADRTGTLAWDLYAGVGLFSRILTETFTTVVGVETIVGDLANVLKGSTHRAVGSTVLDFLRMAILQRERPDLIVMDPPRAGIGLEACELLGRIQAPQMVYVSCDPVTLARDLKAMVDSGYTIQQLHQVDLFPQTFHMETVVLLTRLP